MPAILDFADPAQKGFLLGRHGTDHVVDINTFFYEGVENDTERFVFLLDTAKAFDSIEHGWIFHVLKHLSFPRWFIFFVRAMLSDVSVARSHAIIQTFISVLPLVSGRQPRFGLTFCEG